MTMGGCVYKSVCVAEGRVFHKAEDENLLRVHGISICIFSTGF